ncbi:tetra-peptide repeat homeobox protein 1-like [Lutzomyia longipalpis]|uniref:tetra-peptide repeat homeobox protein 1-like n=1 Tax=Lutzomyia longipalpis TaxID=7200 RepID=UPI0024832EE3|nr:tetra-peptide repeat homeobox protein 1-like [Lutzomyia longipalpis]
MKCLCFVVLSLVTLVVVAEEKPPEGRKGKRGIFDFGYGYDGYAADFGHFDHGFLPGPYPGPYPGPFPGPGPWLPHGGIIGAHTNTIITKKIGFPVPVPVDRHIPVPVKVPVAVPVPYPVVKHLPVPVVKHIPVPYPKPYPVPIVAKPLLHDPWLGPKIW